MAYRGAVIPVQALALNAAIVDAYSGKKGEYAVNVTIIPSEMAKLGNYVTVMEGSGTSETSGNGGRTTTLYKNDPAGASMDKVIAHEAGHLMGAGNQYYSDGSPKPGYEKSNMANAKNGIVGEKDIKNIIDANPAAKKIEGYKK